MNSLVKAMNKTAVTTNGDVAFHSSLDSCVDLFYAAGSSRGKNLGKVFDQAAGTDAEAALRSLLWMRDVRGGAGERQAFRNLFATALAWYTNILKRDASVFIEAAVNVGRWDDLLCLMGTKYEAVACKLWVDAIQNGSALAAKWAPRKDKKGAKPLRKLAGLNEQQWRQLVVKASSTVEQKMCAKQFDSINFSHVPSQAMSKYLTAFHRNTPELFAQWKEELATGESKVNAGAIYPYQIVKANGVDATVAQAQWDAQPDYLGSTTQRLLPVIDVSGSMLCKVAGTTSAMDIAISLGIYISERNTGIFNNVCMSFSTKPRLYTLTGNLGKKARDIRHRENVGYSTNLDVTFGTLLNAAVHNKIPEAEMPTKLFIVSDMQFNGGFCETNNDFSTSYDRARIAYETAGYKLPQIVYWNVNAPTGQCPVTIDSNGTALVSGFSPAIMKSLLADNLSPVSVMQDALSDSRYNI